MPTGGKNKKVDKSALLTKEAVVSQESGLSYFVLKKAERLASALYMVTNLFPAGDPLQRRMRSLGLDILSFTSRQGSFVKTTSLGNRGLPLMINEIRALLNVALATRLLSPMNHEMLDAEYDGLLKAIRENIGRTEDSTLGNFDKSFFDVGGVISLGGAISQEEMSPRGEVWGRESLRGFGKGHHKGHSSVECPIESDGLIRAYPPSPMREKPDTAVSGYGRKMSSIAKGARRSAVIKLVKKKGSVSIKDISEAIKDCGVKTLQRELVSLVGEGVLKKEGERRWSTYTLAS